MAQLELVAHTFKILSTMPSITSAVLNNKANRVTANWSVRNIDKGKSTKFVTEHLMAANLNVVAESDFGTDVSNALLTTVSPSEKYKAVIREEKDKTGKKQQLLEIWNRLTLMRSVDLTALDLHGEVYVNGEFGCLSWAEDESSVLYVAEKKLPKAEPFMKRKLEAMKAKAAEASGSEAGEPARPGVEHVYRPDWGEQMTGKHLSVVVACRLDAEKLTVYSGLPDGCCPGQVRFSPDGASVVGVAWETEPRRLGLVFCTNRPSFIFSLTHDGKMTKLSKDGMSVRSPRYNKLGELAWLQRTAGGPHHAAHQIVIKKKDSDEVSVVVDIVQTEMKIENEHSFFGVYCQSLPVNCFSEDSKRLIFSTAQEFETRSFVVDIDGGRMVDISYNVAGSTTVLDVKSDVILATFSNLSTPARLVAAKLPAQGSEGEIKWVDVSKSIQVPKGISTSSVEYLKLDHPESTDDVKSFTALYISPTCKEGTKFPLIVWPHGGPHASFTNSYSLEVAMLNLLGFAIVQVNYRGSTGAGDASVKFLPQRVGDADVKDCKLASDTVIAKYPIDEDKVVLLGGSHGGFLVTHLSGQYPDAFKAVVCRNPVIDVASMFNSTDIADWCAVESGFEFTEAGSVSEAQLVEMRRRSPLSVVHRVRAPTALLLGAADRRVPHHQGLEYARRLRANGVETQVYMYDDNHSLSALPNEIDSLINSAYWLLSHL